MTHTQKRNIRVLIADSARTDVHKLPIPSGEHDCEVVTIITSVGGFDTPGRPSYFIRLNGIRERINSAFADGKATKITS